MYGWMNVRIRSGWSRARLGHIYEDGGLMCESQKDLRNW